MSRAKKQPWAAVLLGIRVTHGFLSGGNRFFRIPPTAAYSVKGGDANGTNEMSSGEDEP